MARSGADPEKLQQHLESWDAAGEHFMTLLEKLDTFGQELAATVDMEDRVARAFWNSWHNGFRQLVDIVTGSHVLIDGTWKGLSLTAKGLGNVDAVTREAAHRLAGGTGEGLPGGSAHRP
ncbi:hypothetical protein [Streptomyces olivaceoviridis]